MYLISFIYFLLIRNGFTSLTRITFLCNFICRELQSRSLSAGQHQTEVQVGKVAASCGQRFATSEEAKEGDKGLGWQEKGISTP